MQRYDNVIQDQLDKGIIERVGRATCNEIQHYTPHHYVIFTPQKTTTKLREAYDASMKVKKENKRPPCILPHIIDKQLHVPGPQCDMGK